MIIIDIVFDRPKHKKKKRKEKIDSTISIENELREINKLRY